MRNESGPKAKSQEAANQADFVATREDGVSRYAPDSIAMSVRVIA